MARETPHTLTKSARFHVRATGRQAKLIRAGAQAKGLKLSEYVIGSLCVQAEMDLADQNHFVLPKEKWNSFLRELDRTPKVTAGLKRLFARSPVAESR